MMCVYIICNYNYSYRCQKVMYRRIKEREKGDNGNTSIGPICIWSSFIDMFQPPHSYLIWEVGA